MVIRVGDLLKINAAGQDKVMCVERVLKISSENSYRVYDVDDKNSRSDIYDKDIKQIKVDGSWIAYVPQGKQKPFII
ncbi:MAG: hypothetical protein FWG32_08690 [Oscillospiraceae bacterium]|nr:hypothetical protein [Oscillospiraceae bacterium]